VSYTRRPGHIYCHLRAKKKAHLSLQASQLAKIPFENAAMSYNGALGSSADRHQKKKNHHPKGNIPQRILTRQSSFNATERIFREFKGGASYGKQRFYTVKAVNKRCKTNREDRLNWKSKNLNVIDSGWTGRLIKHLLVGPLGLVLAEMTCYTFVINLFFACLFTLLGGCCDTPNHFWDNFNFSFQTFITVGYGELYPEGTLSNIIVFFQGIHNIFLTTIFAGVVFTKFIQPSWKMKFSDVMVVRNVRGVPTLETRFGNVDGEFTNLHSVNATMFLKWSEVDDDNALFRAVHSLDLVNDSRFEMRDVWTLQHRIDPDSPLYAKTYGQIVAAKAMIYVTVTGVDVITQEAITCTTGYYAEDILYGYRFADQVSYDAETDTTTFDYANLSKSIPANVYYCIPLGDEDEELINENGMALSPQSAQLNHALDNLPLDDDSEEEDDTAAQSSKEVSDSAAKKEAEAESVGHYGSC